MHMWRRRGLDKRQLGSMTVQSFYGCMLLYQKRISPLPYRSHRITSTKVLQLCAGSL
jgi:hypothetical protein